MSTRAPGAAIHRHAGAGPERGSIASPCSSRPRRCSATNGRTSAISCTSTSNAWAASSGVGHRIHGDRRRRSRRVGWEYLHVAIDDATRLTYAEVLPAQDKVACAAFLQRTLAWFRRRGVDHPTPAHRQRDGLPGPCAPATSCRRWLVRHRFTRPYRPQTNGKAERFIQTLLREWAYRTPYRRSAGRTAALRPYLRFYNHRRPHASLGRRSPWMRFQEAA